MIMSLRLTSTMFITTPKVVHAPRSRKHFAAATSHACAGSTHPVVTAPWARLVQLLPEVPFVRRHQGNHYLADFVRLLLVDSPRSIPPRRCRGWVVGGFDDVKDDSPLLVAVRRLDVHLLSAPPHLDDSPFVDWVARTPRRGVNFDLLIPSSKHN